MTDDSRVDLLAAFGRLAERLIQAQELDDLVWNLAESVGLDFGFPDCVIYLLEDRELVQAAAFGPKSPQRGTITQPLRIPLGQGITGSAAGDVRSVCVADTRSDPRYVADIFEGRSELAVPITYSDAVLGVIDSESDQVGFYGDLETQTLETIAHLMAPRIATALEVDRRRLAEQGLRKSQDRFEDLVDSIEGVVWEAEPQDFAYRFVSRQAERLLLHPVTKWLDSFQGWLELVHPEDRGLAEGIRRRVATEMRASVCEYRLIAQSGAEIWVRDSVSPVIDDGRLTALRGVLIDVTQGHLDHQRAIRSDQAKSRFLTNMSHEVRTPLHAIMGLTERLSLGDLGPEARRSVRLIESAADALRAWFDDLLELTLLDAGKISLASRPFSIRELARSLVDLHAVNAEAKGLEVRLVTDPEVPEFVVGDANRVRQAVAQLLGNAVKFTQQGWVEVSVKPERSGLELTVSDTGPGIPPEETQAVFERFYQLDASAGRKAAGAGLGLAMAKELVELLGGDITVAQQESGTTMRVWLPLNASRPNPIATSNPPVGTSVEGRRILVVEDNEVNRLLAESLLEHLGLESEIAEDGEQCLFLLRCRPRGWFDLVMMDCQMPGLDGYDATRRIRQAEPSDGRIPILAVTAHAKYNDREKCIAAGMDDYLAKPYRLEDLRRKLEALLGPPVHDTP